MNFKKAFASLYLLTTVCTYSMTNSKCICKPGDFRSDEIRFKLRYTHNTHSDLIKNNGRDGLGLLARSAFENNKLLMTLEQAYYCIHQVCNEENTILIVASIYKKMENYIKCFMTLWVEEAQLIDADYYSTGHKLSGVYPWR